MLRRGFLLLFWLILAGCQAINPTPEALRLPIRLLSFWESQTGTLASADEAQPFQFVGQAGDQVRIRAQGTAELRLALEDDQGARLAEGTSSLEAELPGSGVFTVIIQADQLAQYEIELEYADRINPADYTATPPPTLTPSATPPYYVRLGTRIGDLASGQTRTGIFAAPEERHVYTFRGRVGDYIGAAMEAASGTVDPVMRLYGPDGNELAVDDNSGLAGAAVLRNVRLPLDGLYSLQVWGRGFSGEYRLRLLTTQAPLQVTPSFLPRPTETPPPPVVTPTLRPAVSGETLLDHQPVVGAIERSGDFDRYFVSLTQGEMATFGLRLPADSALRPRLELYDPEGSLIAVATPADSNAGGDALIAALLAAQNGVYSLFITGERGSTGNYVVSYGEGFSHTDVTRGLTMPDQVYAGEIPRRGLRESWPLDLREGDVVSAAVSPLNLNFQPVLELAAANGALVAMGEFTGGREVQIAAVRAPQTGRYTLRVSADGAVGAGGYTLVWRSISLAPTAVPPPGTVPLLTVEDVVADNRYLLYPFYGQAGTRVRVRVTAKPGSSLDPVAALLGPDGAVIAEGDDSPEGLNPSFEVILPADGFYRARVNGYLSIGPFTVTVEALYDVPIRP
jgi:hypothetical protein